MHALSRFRALASLVALFHILHSVGYGTYTNHLTLPNEWANYGLGDPFVMKYNGTFYLYCSTLNNSVGVKCWTSTDCVNWTYFGLCSTDSITTTAYAPEVVYWNGTFYMYTSPNGGGHYVLTSSSPSGPFTSATGNLGHGIDGDVFIDDNGSWYFFNSGSDGVHGSTMSSPTSIGTESTIAGTQVSGQWTEAPTALKRNGIYYLSSVGNHVLSTGYRVNVASNSTGPLSSYTPSNINPIILNTEGSLVGLGHNGIFVGPDLDTYYTVYHNLVGVATQGWPLRELCLDAIGWNGNKMVVYGPTSWSMQFPAAADFEDRFQRSTIGTGYSNINGGTWGISGNFLTQTATGSNLLLIEYENTFTTGSDYTAEYVVQEVSRGTIAPKCGAIFGHTASNNYGIALINGAANQFQTNMVINGVWGTQVNTTLPTGLDPTKLHTLRIEKSGTSYRFFIDRMLVETKTGAGLGAGHVGYLSCDDSAKFGYIACSNKVDGSGIFDFYKPVPGTIQAVHYNSGGEGIGYHDTTSGNTGGAYIRNDNVDIRDCPEGGENIGWNATGEWYKYNVNVQSTGTYNLALKYATTYTTSQVRIWCDSTDVSGVVTLPTTSDWNTFLAYTIKGLSLPAGNHIIKLETVTGEFDFYTLSFDLADNSSFTKIDNFTSGFSSDWNYSDGTWTASGTASVSGTGKRTMGSTGWSDYTVECDINASSGLNSGIMVRVQNPAQGGAGNDPGLGTDFYQGYFCGISPGGVVLGKENYGWTTLNSVSGTYSLNTWYHMKVVVKGYHFQVYVGDMNTPLIDYFDLSDPFPNGKVGLRALNSPTQFDNFMVTTDNLVSSHKTTTYLSNTDSAHTGAASVDNDNNSYWCASSGAFPQWLQVDLGASYNLAKIETIFYANETWNYKIEGMVAGGSWFTILDHTAGVATGDIAESCSGTARYIKITVTGSGGDWAAIREFKVSSQ